MSATDSIAFKSGNGVFLRVLVFTFRGSHFTHHALWVSALLSLSVAFASASPFSALREYNAGQYDQSLKEYEQLLQRHSDDPRLHFNAGTAAYRGRRFEEAAKQFNDALVSQNLKLQEQAYYNLGNTLFQLGARNPDPSKRIEAWENALKSYTNTLALNREDADAKFNYDFVKKKLEELKQQQQQQQQNKDKNDQGQQQNDQQQNQDQKKDQQQNKEQQSQQQKQDEQEKQQQQANSQSKEQREKEQKEKERQQQEQQQKEQQANPSKQKPDEKDQRQPAQSYAAAQMTPEQAQQLLEAQKGDEAILPIKPTEKPKQSNRPLKDW